jgi:acetyl esterase/lipase
MSVAEAIRGITLDISSRPTLSAKVRALQSHAVVLGREVLGIVGMAPFALTSFWLYQRLGSEHGRLNVSLVKNLRYGPAPRNVLDVYSHRGAPQGVIRVGPSGDSQLDDPVDTRLPVVLFVHGGVWSSGSKWHYAKMASRLAEEGITTCVAEYSLYPTCTSERMVKEIGRALDWVVEHCAAAESRGVVLVGHSAGAHLCAMLLLDRARASTGGAPGSPSHPQSYVPGRFVGMAGVYDIARHYEYEKRRNVHHLSTMRRAVGGPESFAGQSPTVVLGSTDIHVERLPSIHLMASRGDVTVPHIESADLHALLRSRGCPDVRFSLYENVGHGDFVVDWRPRGASDDSSIEQYTSNLPPYAQDLVRSILDGVPGPFIPGAARRRRR